MKETRFKERFITDLGLFLHYLLVHNWVCSGNLQTNRFCFYKSNYRKNFIRSIKTCYKSKIPHDADISCHSAVHQISNGIRHHLNNPIFCLTFASLCFRLNNVKICKNFSAFFCCFFKHYIIYACWQPKWSLKLWWLLFIFSSDCLSIGMQQKSM